jgi:hypothetical protein
MHAYHPLSVIADSPFCSRVKSTVWMVEGPSEVASSLYPKQTPWGQNRVITPGVSLGCLLLTLLQGPCSWVHLPRTWYLAGSSRTKGMLGMNTWESSTVGFVTGCWQASCAQNKASKDHHQPLFMANTYMRKHCCYYGSTMYHQGVKWESCGSCKHAPPARLR